jgi:2-polyprenyl-6-methoxyphenol hydroxylase-like FAD-dependent oxidoreductase
MPGADGLHSRARRSLGVEIHHWPILLGICGAIALATTAYLTWATATASRFTVVVAKVGSNVNMF